MSLSCARPRIWRPALIQIECATVRIRADYDVRRRLEDRSQTVVGRFGALPLADLALERIHLFPQFPLGTLQCVVLRLDLGQHLIEGVGQNSDLVTAHFVCADGVVLVVCDGARGARQPEDRIGNETQKLPRKEEGEKEGRGENQGKNAAIEF